MIANRVAWNRLQHISCAHAATIGKCAGFGRGGKLLHFPPEVIRYDAI